MEMKAYHVLMIVILLLLSTADLIAHWLNWIDFRSDAYSYGLVVGPPTQPAINSLLVFTITGSVFFVIEISNTLTMLFMGFTPRLPLETEQMFVLLLEKIPLALTNLFIVVCRARQNTIRQIVTGAIALANATFRFVICANLSERIPERLQDPGTFRNISYGASSIAWVVHLILQGLVWSGLRTPTSLLPSTETTTVMNNSIFLLHQPQWDIRYKVANLDITQTLQAQGLSLDNPWLVKETAAFNSEKELQHGYPAFYNCPTHNSTFSQVLQPLQCIDETVHSIIFRFFYKPLEVSSSAPFGMVLYSVGCVDIRGQCRACEWDGENGDWKLLYFEAILEAGINSTDKVFVTSPWPLACTGVYPKYEPALAPCVGKIT